MENAYNQPTDRVGKIGRALFARSHGSPARALAFSRLATFIHAQLVISVSWLYTFSLLLHAAAVIPDQCMKEGQCIGPQF
jgi:hypothetical protein